MPAFTVLLNASSGGGFSRKRTIFPSPSSRATPNWLGLSTLTTSPLGTFSSKGTDYTLSAKGIRDCARKPNVLAAGARQTFRYAPLFARWKLDEAKGLVATDASESKLDGALKGAPVKGIQGKYEVTHTAAV